jgi:hypothetical protein
MVAEWPAEPGWRVRTGVGLVIHAPLSDERRALVERESAKEAAAEKLAAELRSDRELERAPELRRQGYEFHSVADTLARASFGQDRADAAEAKRVKAGAEAQGLPEPRFDRWESKANVAAAEAAREVTPATKADARELQSQVAGHKASLHDLREAVAGQLAEVWRKW